MITLERIPGGSMVMHCDFCQHHPAEYHSIHDETWLCERCLAKYLREYEITHYEVRIL